MKNDQAATATSNAAKAEAPKFKEPPRYRLKERAFFCEVKMKRGREWVPYADVLLDPEIMPLASPLSGPHDGVSGGERMPMEIEFLGIPDEHMEPLNDAGHWMLENVDMLKQKASEQAARKGGKKGRNPIDSLTIVGPGAAVLNPAQDSV